MGKYVALHDAYLSVVEALAHGGHRKRSAGGHCAGWIPRALTDEQRRSRSLGGCSGVIVPGGFGSRGSGGNDLRHPLGPRELGPRISGICLGMQMAVVEFARHMWRGCRTPIPASWPATAHPVIDLMPDQRDVHQQGRDHAPGVPIPAGFTGRGHQGHARPMAQSRDPGAPPPPL